MTKKDGKLEKDLIYILEDIIGFKHYDPVFDALVENKIFFVTKFLYQDDSDYQGLKYSKPSVNADGEVDYTSC